MADTSHQLCAKVVLLAVDGANVRRAVAVARLPPAPNPLLLAVALRQLVVETDGETGRHRPLPLVGMFLLVRAAMHQLHLARVRVNRGLRLKLPQLLVESTCPVTSGIVSRVGQ